MSDSPQLKPVAPLLEPKKMLVVVAHHDDIEFGMAGALARWIDEGADVSYVIITDGGAGSNEPTTIREELVETRRQEQLEAAAAIGVTDVRFLGHTDGVLTPTLELRRDVTRIIRELKPYRVLCQDPTTVFAWDSYINHPDHRAAGEIATYATFPSAESRPIFPELLAEGYEPHKVSELYLTLTRNPTHYVDITSTIERKIASLRAHVSQIGAGEKAEQGALKWIREGNQRSGEQVGVAYAEFYKVMKFDRDGEEAEQDQAETQEARS